MTRGWLRLSVPGVWLFAAACAPQTDERAAESAPAGQARVNAPERLRPSERGKVSSISLENLFLLHQSDRAYVVDTRPAFYFEAGRIPGAVNLPRAQSPQGLAPLEDDIKRAVADGKTVVVYCSGVFCADARAVARHIAGRGYPVSIFTGGWDAWNNAGLPLEAIDL